MSNTQSGKDIILLIDDEPAITESLDYMLSGASFTVMIAHTLHEATQLLSQAPTLIILDLILPDGHGFDWLRELRKSSNIPVIILSSHDDEVEHIVGLELGADDYIDKPFSAREVLARIRAILRRSTSLSAQSLSSQSSITDESIPVLLDRTSHRVMIKNLPLNCSRLEFELLAYLFEHPDKVHTRRALIREVWGSGVYINERTVDVHIKALRKKLDEMGNLGSLIETVRGVGYRYNPSLEKV